MVGNYLQAVILVCSLGTTPNYQDDCNRDNAVDVMYVPNSSASPVGCAVQGMQYLAGNEIGRTLDPNERPLVKCRPTDMVPH